MISFILQRILFFLHFLEEYQINSISSVGAFWLSLLEAQDRKLCFRIQDEMQKLPDEFRKLWGIGEGHEHRTMDGKRVWKARKNPEEILAMHSVPIKALISSIRLELQTLSRHHWWPYTSGCRSSRMGLVTPTVLYLSYKAPECFSKIVWPMAKMIDKTTFKDVFQHTSIWF